MYMFGGSSPREIAPNQVLWCLDLRTFKWEHVKAKGNPPESRDEHTAVSDNQSMIIFGGFIDGERTDSVFRFIFNENRWENITPNNSEL